MGEIAPITVLSFSLSVFGLAFVDLYRLHTWFGFQHPVA